MLDEAQPRADDLDGDIVSIAKPRTIAAVVAASPRAIEVRPSSRVEAWSTRTLIGWGKDHTELTSATTRWERTEPGLVRRGQWALFERIGLGQALTANRASKAIVSVYRLLGFAILSAVVFALVSYIATTLFYLLSHSWVVPTVVSATDDKVVALQRELSTQQNQRDRLAADLDDSERALAAEQSFQVEFAKAIKSDLRDRTAALERVQALAQAAADTRRRVRQSSEDFARASQDRMAKQYDAGLIDRQAMLDGKFQIAQITSSTLSLAERQAAFETRAEELKLQTDSLDAILADRDAPLSYDVLKIKRDFDASKLAVARAIANRSTLVASLKRQDQIIASLKSSAQLRALIDHATVALVPYGNLDGVEPGTSLYACSVGMLWCHEVGTVIAVLPGEVQLHHPHRDTQVRGQMIEMRLADPAAAEDSVLFVGGRPFGI